jgi:signal peptidase I
MTELGFDNEPREPGEAHSDMRRPRKRSKPTKRGWFARAKRNVFVAFIIDLVVIVGAALILSLLVKTFLIRSFFVPSGSMLSTLQIDDRIVVNELVPNVVPVEHGDVLVFKDPGGWLTDIQPNTASKTVLEQASEFVLSAFGFAAPDSAQHLVKRTIGLPGDHIKCCDATGHLTINGVAINEVYLDKGIEPSLVNFDVTVPAHKLWMMGDNRSSSSDSRFHIDLPSKGFVDESFVVGRAFVVSWPINHWQWLDNFSSVFKDVPQPKN